MGTMKMHNYIRKTSGAVLGFVVACMFLLLIIGVFLFFASCLFSGNQQLNKASDAGILNAARQAIVQPAIALNDATLPNKDIWPYTDFALPVGKADSIADQNVNGFPAIDLATFNRC